MKKKQLIVLILFISAIFINGISNSITEAKLFFKDNNPPEIKNVLVKPTFTFEGHSVNVSAEIIDDIEVERVEMILVYPYGEKYDIIKMMPIEHTNYYYFEQIYTVLGNYSLYIRAFDLDQNMNYSNIYYFDIVSTFVIGFLDASIGKVGINWQDYEGKPAYGKPWFDIKDVFFNNSAIYTIDNTVEYKVSANTFSNIEPSGGDLSFERIAKIRLIVHEYGDDMEFYSYWTEAHKEGNIPGFIPPADAYLYSYEDENITLNATVEIYPKINCLPGIIEMIFGLFGIHIDIPPWFTTAWGPYETKMVHIYFHIVHLYPPTTSSM